MSISLRRESNATPWQSSTCHLTSHAVTPQMIASPRGPRKYVFGVQQPPSRSSPTFLALDGHYTPKMFSDLHKRFANVFRPGHRRTQSAARPAGGGGATPAAAGPPPAAHHAAGPGLSRMRLGTEDDPEQNPLMVCGLHVSCTRSLTRRVDRVLHMGCAPR